MVIKNKRKKATKSDYDSHAKRGLYPLMTFRRQAYWAPIADRPVDVLRRRGGWQSVLIPLWYRDMDWRHGSHDRRMHSSAPKPVTNRTQYKPLVWFLSSEYHWEKFVVKTPHPSRLRRATFPSRGRLTRVVRVVGVADSTEWVLR